MTSFTNFILTAATIGFLISFGDAKCRISPTAVESGGLVKNPNMDDGIKGWEPVGTANISVGQSSTGNNFVVASDRKLSTDTVGQTVKNVQKGRYILTAWIRFNLGTGRVTPVFRTVSGLSYYLGDPVEVGAGCWTQLVSSFTFDSSEPLLLYFESRDLADLWADAVSVVAAA